MSQSSSPERQPASGDQMRNHLVNVMTTIFLEDVLSDIPVIERGPVAEGFARIAPYGESVTNSAPERTSELMAPYQALMRDDQPLVRTPDLHSIRDLLLIEFPYAAAAIDPILRDLVARKFVKFRPTLLVGEPGCGKSRFARRFGEAIGVHVARVDAASLDGAFGGTSRRYNSTEPCFPLRAIAQAKQANPLIVLDELEKAATNRRDGRLWDVLLAFLEHETCVRFHDTALQMDFDLSFPSYIFTANSRTDIPAPLLDRLRVIEFPQPTAEHLPFLLRRVVDDLANEEGIDPRFYYDDVDEQRETIEQVWQSGSIRRLRRIVATILASPPLGRSSH